MTARTFALAALAIVAVGTALALAVGGVAGHSHAGYAVEQGDQCVPVAPVTGDEPADAFYDYRAHDSNFSSQGTRRYQENDASLLVLYEGPDGLSLVVVHDRWPEDSADVTNGGSASFAVSGLPAAGEWTVEDDDYPNQTDEFHHDGTESDLHWTWTEGRTDGAVFTGLGDDFHVRIDARWNQDARLDDTYDEGYDGVIADWQVISATADGDGFDRVSLSSLDEPVTIRSGDCGADDPEAVIDAGSTGLEAGETVGFDGTGSDGSIETYEWEFGDGETATGATVEHAYDEPGEYEVALTVTDSAGTTDTTTVTVTVESSSPEASLAVPDEVSVGEDVVLDASDSAVATDEATYRWSVDGDEVAATDEPTLEWRFDDAGEYEVTVTVVDAEDRRDADSATIAVRAELRAVVDANATEVEVGEPVSFDGGDSEGDVEEYRWDFGDGATASGAAVEHAFDEPGEYRVELAVTSGDETATTTVAVEVVEPEGDDDADEGDADDADEGDEGDADEGDEGDADESDDSSSGDSGSGGSSSGGSSGGGSSAGGSSGGGTGTSSTSTSSTPDSYEADVEADGREGATFLAEDVEADVPVVAELGLDGPVGMETITLMPAEGTDEFAGEVRLVEDSGPPGRIPGIAGAFDVGADSSVSETEIEATVDREHVDAAGANPDDLALFRHADGEWIPVDTEVEVGDDRVHLRAETDGTARFGVGVTDAAVSVDDVAVERAVAGEPFEVTVTLRNVGPEEGDVTVPITLDGERIGEVSTAVPADGTAEETIAVETGEAGEVTIAAEDRSTTVDVLERRTDLSVVDVRAEESQISAGEAVMIVVVVENAGTVEGEFAGKVTVDGEIVGTVTATVGPGDREQVTITQHIESPGTYEVAVDGVATAIDVVDPDDADDDAASAGATADDTAGFTPLAALLALIAAAAALRRRG